MTDLQSEAQPDEQWRIVEPLTLTPLLTAALEVFHELGYHGASVRDIAKRAGVTVPTLYYHHGNKQGILV
ncbi:helix-turn-helix domain-containing protein, partial [Rhodococcus sp. (in: high G+C Gram-positive bacteria)]